MGQDRGVHPGFYNIADGVVVFICFKAVYCKAGAVDSELDPAEEELGGGLGSFEAADVVAVGLLDVNLEFMNV